jgi:hypothetical protein
MSTNSGTELAAAKRRKRHHAIRRFLASIGRRGKSFSVFYGVPERFTDDEIAYLASVAARLAAELTTELRERNQRGAA